MTSVVGVNVPSLGEQAITAPQRSNPDNRYVLGARVFVTLRAAIRAKTQSRSAGVMIAGHTAGPITCP